MNLHSKICLCTSVFRSSFEISKKDKYLRTEGVIDNAISLQAAEAIAPRSGLKPMDRLGCCNVQVESDCLELVQACNGDNEIWSPRSAILADGFLLAHNIPGINFKHGPREANGVAHFLASRTISRIYLPLFV